MKLILKRRLKETSKNTAIHQRATDMSADDLPVGVHETILSKREKEHMRTDCERSKTYALFFINR